MIIPHKYQVFDDEVAMSDEQEKRLSPYLSNFNKLYAKLVDGVNDDDLRRMLIIELMGKARPAIIDRIRKRLLRQTRERIDAKIENLLVL